MPIRNDRISAWGTPTIAYRSGDSEKQVSYLVQLVPLVLKKNTRGLFVAAGSC